MTGPRGQESTPTAAPLPEADGSAGVRNPTGPETSESEPAPPPSALPDDILRAITHYRPRVCSPEEFGLISEALQQALIAYAPPNATSGVNGPGAHLAKFMVWVVNRPGRIDRQSRLQLRELAEHGLVDSYLATGMELIPKDTRATARSVLRRAIELLTEQPRETLSHSTIQPHTPMTRSE